MFLVPGKPILNGVSTIANTIIISWSLPTGSVVTNHSIAWVRNTSMGCAEIDSGVVTLNDGSVFSYYITGLEEGSSYSITVEATNAAGSSGPSNSKTVMIEDAGTSYITIIYYLCSYRKWVLNS